MSDSWSPRRRWRQFPEIPIDTQKAPLEIARPLKRARVVRVGKLQASVVRSLGPVEWEERGLSARFEGGVSRKGGSSTRPKGSVLCVDLSAVPPVGMGTSRDRGEGGVGRERLNHCDESERTGSQRRGHRPQLRLTLFVLVFNYGRREAHKPVLSEPLVAFINAREIGKIENTFGIMVQKLYNTHSLVAYTAKQETIQRSPVRECDRGHPVKSIRPKQQTP